MMAIPLIAGATLFALYVFYVMFVQCPHRWHDFIEDRKANCLGWTKIAGWQPDYCIKCGKKAGPETYLVNLGDPVFAQKPRYAEDE